MSNIEVFVEKFADNYGFTNTKFQYESGAEDGDNFAGILSRVKISGDLNGAAYTLQVIVKSAPTCLKTRESAPIRDMFVREIYAYSQVFPVLDKLQSELQEDEQFRFIKCYAWNSDLLNEHIVMEDLMLQSYRLHRPRLESLDLEHLCVALTTLAKLHALSYVLQDRNPEVFSTLAAGADDSLFTAPDGFMKAYSESAAEKAINAIVDEALIQKLEPFAKDIYSILGKLLVPNKYAVLCHGDYWKNNILYLYQDGKPVSACPLDYQTFRYTSPLTDFTYLMFCCSSQELRKQQFWSLLSVYYDALRDHLKKFSLEIENVFPRKEFMKEVDRMGSFGLGSAILDLMFMSCATEDIIYGTNDVASGEDSANNQDSNRFKLYKERMKGVVEDCIEFGFLK